MRRILNVDYLSEFLSVEETAQIMTELDDLRVSGLFEKDGKKRKIICFGDEGVKYFFNDRSHSAHIWTESLQKIRTRVQPFCSHLINFLLMRTEMSS